MRKDQLIRVANIIVSGMKRSGKSTRTNRGLLGYIRLLGDEIGEPILVDDGSLPTNYVKVSLPSGNKNLKPIELAMSVRAAESLLARA